MGDVEVHLELRQHVGRRVLDVPLRTSFSGTEVDTHSVREYLTHVLERLWRTGTFERPQGVYASWRWDLYDALFRAGLIRAYCDEYGYVQGLHEGQEALADHLIHLAIRELGRAS